MNPSASSRRTLAFTLVEMLTVIAIIGILAAILLPVLNRSEVRTKRVICITGQQQIGLAFHTFSNDHNGKFPMAISTNDGGSMEFVQDGYTAGPVFYTAYHHFQPLSNELVFPKTVICPSDMTRVAATNFAAMQNENLSYFVGVQSTFDKPLTVLAGDRNLATNAYEQPTIVQLGQWSKLAWTWELHQYKGNVLFADGHVEQWNDSLMAAAGGASAANQTFFMPSVIATVSPVANGGPGSGPMGPTGPGPGPSGSGGSGPTPSGPTGPQSEHWVSSPAGGGRMNGGDSSPSGGGSSPGAQPAQWAPYSSYGERVYATETVSDAQSPLIARTVPAIADTNDIVSVQDTNSGMSSFDQHMTMVMQNSLAWLYLLICIVVLLYLLNRLRKRLAGKRDQEDTL